MHAQSSASHLSNLDNYLEHLHTTGGFSGELLIAQAGAVRYHKVMGLAHEGLQVPLRGGEIYHIASLTKGFTGKLIREAMEEGRLNPTDKIRSFLPGLEDKFGAISVEHLLQHRSGLPHNKGIEDYWPVKSKLELTPEEILAEINQLALISAPGTEYHYSSPGYYLLGRLLEQLYERPFHELLAEKIWQPAKLEQTGTANSLDIIPGEVAGYHWAKEDSLIKAPYRNYGMIMGAGDLRSSAIDLWKWAEYCWAEEAAPAESDTYSFGWMIASSPRLKYFHGGGTWGFNSLLAHYPQENLTIVLLVNRSFVPVISWGQQIERIWFGEKFTAPDVSVSDKGTDQDYALYAGTYQSETSAMKLQIMRHEGDLYAKLGPNPPFQIFPRTAHQFFGKKVAVEFSFEEQAGKIIGVSATRMGQSFHFTKTSGS